MTVSATAAPHDPLRHADPSVAADAAATDALLRCWIRETGAPVGRAGTTFALDLPVGGSRIEAEVIHRSPTGWHRFDRPRLASGRACGAAALAGALASEIADRCDRDPAATNAFARRVLESADVITSHLAARRRAPEDPTSPLSFLAGEQALLLGHPFHPTPKSRPGVAGKELADLSPELRGRLRLRWLAAHPTVVAGEAAGPGRDLATIARRLAVGVEAPPGWTPIPVHPVQARALPTRRGLAELFDAGLLRDLGEGAEEWFPTSSLRTVYRPGAPAMLKLSLGLRITNSRRENLRGELMLGVRAARLLDALSAAPTPETSGFGVLRDAAWLGVDPAAGVTHSGLDVAIRDNPFAPSAPVVCLAGLVAERPESARSRLGERIDAICDASSDVRDEVAARWVSRFVDAVVSPVLSLLETHGIGLEAHQQNLLVVLDDEGMPSGGWYRDGQGCYVASRAADAALAAVPDLEDGDRAVFHDRLVEDRVIYYLVVNALFGLIGALGAEGHDEDALLGAARARLEALARAGDRLAARVVDERTLPCKANLLTCADGRDELDGPVEEQSIYVAIPNPLRRPAP